MTFRKASKLDGIEISLIRQWNSKAKPSTIKMTIGELPYEPPRAVIDAGIKAFAEKRMAYTPNAGLAELRELVALEHESNTGRRTNENNVIITDGVEQALYNTFSTFLNPGDNVLIPEIFFSPYETIPRMNGANVNKFALKEDFSIDLKDLESKLNDRTKLVVINSPANPTGNVLGSEELLELAEILKKHPDVYVASDEIYSHLFFCEKMPDSISKYFDRSIVMNGISKRASATGLRIGWTIAPEEVTKEMLKVQQYTVTCASTPCQYAAIPVLRGQCVQEEKSYRDMLRENRDLTTKLIREIPGTLINNPEGAFYCFPDISQYGSSEKVSQRLLDEADVLVIPGIAFGLRGDNHVRISYAVEHSKLEEGLNRIKGVLK